MEKKKILLGISSSYCANFLKGQVSFLKKNNFDVVIISGEGEEIALLAKEEGATLYTVPFTKKYSFFTDIITLKEIISIIKKENPTIINAGNPKSGFLIMLAAYLLKRKNRIFTLHGLLSDTKKGIARWVVANIEKVSSRMSHTTIVVSKSLMLHAINRHIITAKKAQVLGNGSANGIDINYFNRTELLLQETKQLQQTLHIDATIFTIGFVGRVSYDKGLTLLLDVVKNLKKEIKIQLIVLGPLEPSDPLDKEHTNMLYNDPDVYYLGKVLRVAPYYAMFNVLVLPSLREGFGNVLIEAAAMQVPVIASNIPGIQDAVNNNHNGYLVNINNIDELSDKIKLLHNNIALQKNLGQNGRIFVTEKFNNINVWDNYLNLYNAQ